MYDVKKHENENEEQYIWRIGQKKDSGLLDVTWEDIAENINRQFREDESEYKTEAAYRKPYQQAKRFFEAGAFNNLDETEYIEQLKEQKREIEREKIKFRDERGAWQRQNYIDARVEQKLDVLGERLSEIGRINFLNENNIKECSDNDILVILSDLHIGQCFSSITGEYNSHIAIRRLGDLLKEILQIKKRHNSENCYISLQGDLINGNIHKTIQVTNRENVIEQIKIASEIISNFCYEITRHFSHVYLSSVSGNHSRIDRKEEALHDERLDDLIFWTVEVTLNHVQNFHILKNIDTGISSIDIRGKSYIAVHGDFDGCSKEGVSKLCMYLGQIPYGVLYGHRHTCAVGEYNGVKMIQGGSLSGSGDQYTNEKRLVGKASQMVCVCDNSGICCYYPIYLE